jgi:hypothetical protein
MQIEKIALYAPTKRRNKAWGILDDDQAKREMRNRVADSYRKKQQKMAAQQKQKNDALNERQNRTRRKQALRQKFLDKIAAKERADYESHCKRIKTFVPPGQRHSHKAKRDRDLKIARENATRGLKLRQKRQIIDTAVREEAELFAEHQMDTQGGIDGTAMRIINQCDCCSHKHCCF